MLGGCARTILKENMSLAQYTGQKLAVGRTHPKELVQMRPQTLHGFLAVPHSARFSSSQMDQPDTFKTSFNCGSPAPCHSRGHTLAEFRICTTSPPLVRPLSSLAATAASPFLTPGKLKLAIGHFRLLPKGDSPPRHPKVWSLLRPLWSCYGHALLWLRL